MGKWVRKLLLFWHGKWADYYNDKSSYHVIKYIELIEWDDVKEKW